MKYLLVAAVVLVAYWIWRHNREEEAREAREAREAAQRQRPSQPAIPTQMVTCRHCGVHLPQTEATKGLLGYYCGKEHQRLAEG